MFSLKSLFMGVSIAGLGAAGLIHRTQFWASAVVGVTVCLCLIAVFRTWFVTGDRAFWGPFAVTSAVYLGIVSLPPLAGLHFNLPTTQLVLYGLDELQHATPTLSVGYATPPAIIPAVGDADPTVLSHTMPAALIGYINYDRENLFELAITRPSAGGFHTEARSFLCVAQCLWCLLLAALFGMMCSWMASRHDALTVRNRSQSDE
jgi:hypothetical protein